MKQVQNVERGLNCFGVSERGGGGSTVAVPLEITPPMTLGFKFEILPRKDVFLKFNNLKCFQDHKVHRGRQHRWN
jgi:hypothetical protein